MIGPDGLTLAAEPRHAPASQALIAAFEAELRHRYRADDARVESRTLPDDVFVVARLHGVPVGCGSLHRLDQGRGEVTRLFVDEAHRGLLIGSALLADLERRARNRGIDALLVETDEAQSEAVALYTRSGYSPVPCPDRTTTQPTRQCLEKPIRHREEG